jgi:hypothetical protein
MAEHERPQTVNEQPSQQAGLSLALGRKLAAGRDADVFDLGDGRVLRRNRKGESAQREAEIIRHARAHGYPAPAVYEDAGPDLVMERLDGPTMLEDLGKRPWLLWRHARLLAALHRRLAMIPPLEWLKPFPPPPAPEATVGSSPEPVAGVAPDDVPSRPTTGATSSGQPGPFAAPAPRPSAEPDCLLHLDLHPANVILTPHGPVVIDWSSAKRGTVAAAVALTWVIMVTSQIDDSSLRVRIILAVRHLLVAEFLRHVDRAAVVRQLPAVARFRLGDRNLLPSERPAIHALARRVGVTL